MGEAMELVVVGMGSVFTFLAVLVGLMTLMSWLVARLPQASPGQPSPVPAVHANEDAKLVAAITAAIRKHRSGN
ncbi:MAG: OadG family protein [Gammaproteobacteria bacterium]|jgi:oxaloacetate decarboxylase gamma subunit